ncbi:MAG: tRNA (N6-threonylcarbamoyladenosine(37)-N6)-methyltransferase TrmO [Candidatus Micrarchaeota archaeon]
MEKTIVFKPIGVVHTPFEEGQKIPIQPRFSEAEGIVEIFPEYAEGLSDLDGFSHILLLWHIHRSVGYKLKVKPFLDTKLRGLFATRAPWRPNSIGLSLVKLLSIENNKLKVKGADMFNGTPLLDIKPYVPHFDERRDAQIQIGWLKNKLR